MNYSPTRFILMLRDVERIELVKTADSTQKVTLLNNNGKLVITLRTPSILAEN